MAHLLRQNRKAQGLSQTELAKIAAIPQVTISEVESGARNPSLPTLFALLNALDLEINLKARVKSR